MMRLRPSERVLWLALATALAAEPASAADKAGPSFQAAAAALAPHADGFHLDDQPGSSVLLTRQWDALRRAAAAWLDQHPDANGLEVSAALKALKPASGPVDQGIEASALRLDDKAWLIAARVNEIGTVFILADSGGGFRTAWAIDRPETWGGGRSGPLLAWKPDNAQKSCPARRTGADVRQCGPLYGGIGRLPDAEGGARRFFVDGTYAQPMGATVAGQISIWTWDDAAARPVFSTGYGYMVEQPWTVRTRGDVVAIRTKDAFRRIVACGACEGRQVVKTFRVSPTGLEPLSTQSLTPELDLIDDVYDRLALGQPTAGLATVPAARAMAAQLRQARTVTKPKGPADITAGMIMGWRASGGPGARTVCLETDDSGAAIFTIDAIGRRVLAVQPAAAGACSGPGSRS